MRRTASSSNGGSAGKQSRMWSRNTSSGAVFEPVAIATPRRAVAATSSSAHG